jgi:ABC-2 type transport system permease protein/lipopolysaccharide transport system permease protein
MTLATFEPGQSQQITPKRYWEILKVLVVRNLKTRYRGSILGIYWSLLNPLIMAGIYTAVFGAEFAKYYDDSIINYALAAFTGLLVINFFSIATSGALSSVVYAGSLLNKIRLPVSVFPISKIVENIFQFCVGNLPLLIIVTLFVSKAWKHLFLLGIPLVSLALFSTGVGLIVAALFVFFRDIPYIYDLVVFVLWVTSPVFYPSEIVPAQVKPFIGLNPLVPIIESLRKIALTGLGVNEMPLIKSLLLSSIVCVVGWFIFQRLRPKFMDLL